MRTRRVYRDGTATAGSWCSAAAWLLVLACGGSDDAAQGPLRPADVGPRNAEAPAASEPSQTSMGDEPTNEAGGWARDPASSECSFYADRDAAPDGWLRFDSEIECRCSIESC